jgi:hypothetical protein
MHRGVRFICGIFAATPRCPLEGAAVGVDVGHRMLTNVRRREQPRHCSHAQRGLEHFLALLGCHHVDTTRYSGHLLAPTILAVRLRCLMFGHGLGALERLPAFPATVLVCWHDSGASFSVHCQQSLRPSCRGSTSFRQTRRRAAPPGAQYPTESGRGSGTDLYRRVAVRSIVSPRALQSTDHRTYLCI